MNSQASQSSNSGCDGVSLCVPRSSLMLTNPVPKYACQTRLTNARAVVGDLPVDQPAGERQPRRLAAVGKRVQEGGHTGGDLLAGLEPVAPLEHRRRAALLASHQGQRGRSLGPLLEEGLDPLVGLLEFGDDRPPVGEDDGLLGGRPPGGRDGQDLPHPLGERVGDRVLGRGHAQAEPAEVGLLVVVVVPASVLAHEAEREDRAGGEGDVLLGDEDRLSVGVATAGAGVDAPGGVLLAVDGELDPAGDPLAARPVVERGLEVAVLVRVVGRRLDQLDPALLLRRPGVGGLDLELGQRYRCP